jgi:hypothetical protein
MTRITTGFSPIDPESSGIPILTENLNGGLL